MRLRHVGPGIGGLNYSPLLRNVRRRQPATSPGPSKQATPARTSEEGSPRSLWHSLAAVARRIGQAIIEVRMQQAERLIELEAGRLAGRDGTSFDRSAIGSRYY